MSNKLQINIAFSKFFASHCWRGLHLPTTTFLALLFYLLFVGQIQPVLAQPGSPFGGTAGGTMSYANVVGGNTSNPLLSTSQSGIEARSNSKSYVQKAVDQSQKQPLTGNLAPGGDKSVGNGPGSGAQSIPGATPGPPQRMLLPPAQTTITPQDSAESNLFNISEGELKFSAAEPMVAQEDLAVKTQQAVELPALLQSPQAVVGAVMPVAQSLTNSVAQTLGNAVKGSDEGGDEGGGDGGEEGGGGGGGGSQGAGTVGAALEAILGMPTPLFINVANTPPAGAGVALLPYKQISDAVGMVQSMYKNFFVPFAILLLLPGAVITQVKAQITASFNLKADDASSPFEGILRSIVAVFLIPATQLIVSYSIDVGNSLAYSVNPAISIMPILAWLQQVAYTAPAANSSNSMSQPTQGGLAGESPTGGGETADGGGGGDSASSAAGAATGMGGGAADDEPEDEDVPEEESAQSTMLETMFNAAMFMFSTGLLIMTAFQLAIMCYLYLLGPVAAAFYAWPSVQGKLFRSVFLAIGLMPLLLFHFGVFIGWLL